MKRNMPFENSTVSDQEQSKNSGDPLVSKDTFKLRHIFNPAHWEKDVEFISDENEIIQGIESSSAEEFADFILGSLKENPLRHKLSKNIVRTILKKGFLLYESSSEEDKKEPFPFFIIELERALQLHGDFKSDDPK